MTCMHDYKTNKKINLFFFLYRVEITFVRASGEKIKAKGKVGDSLLDVVVNNQIDFDGFGACEGTLTCSTCHLIFSKSDYDKLPDKPSDEELDMLDLAYDLTDTSRLGCQICLSKNMNDLEVKVFFYFQICLLRINLILICLFYRFQQQSMTQDHKTNIY